MVQIKIQTDLQSTRAPTPAGANERRQENWIDSFIRFTEILHSPKIFRHWTALSLISMVMERKVWARTKGANLYPNLYVILTAPPGIGKSFVLSLAERMLRAVPHIHVAPSSLTTASMIDTLVLSKRQLTAPGPLVRPRV